MLKNGQFSINKSIVYDDQFKYLALPNLNNDGSYVMYGICCCRHASVFLDDVLKILGFDSSLLYIFIDENNCWQVAEPFCANHLVVLLKVNDYEYLLDPIHSFILKKEKDQTLTKLDCDTLELIENYQDSNIDTIGRILKKYYDLDRLGIDYLYDYRY